MKLSGLFAKYLYQNKTLNLPGFGVFTIDPNLPVPDTSDKAFSDFVQQIKFVQKPVIRPDDDFIDFIRTNTGKIRPLAESDLESFLSDGKILLNIGKPFYFEGMGSLQKNRQGKYDFIPGEPLIDRLEVVREEKGPMQLENERLSSQSSLRPPSDDMRKIFILLAILVGLIAVIWGGYLVYSHNKNSASNTSPATTDSTALLGRDSPSTTNLFDSSRTATTSASNSATSQTGKFVIEITKSKNRALRRYAQLKSYLLDIRMETDPDSSLFKLYFVFPYQPSDTLRIKDSLMRMYDTRKVTIE